MKRILLLCLALGVILGMWTSQSLAITQTYLDTTLIQANRSGGEYIAGNWYDIIGGNNFDLYQIEVTWNNKDVIIDIYTNTKNENLNPFFVADVALDLDQYGNWETGIVLNNEGRSSIYANNTMYTFDDSSNSQWEFSSGPNDYVYAAKYDRSNNPDPTGTHDPYDPPVHLKTTATIISSDSVNVSWDFAEDSPTTYLLKITLEGVNASGDWDAFDILWGTQTCANDVQYTQANCVPIPGSVLLLGTGILGLGLLGWRRKPV